MQFCLFSINLYYSNNSFCRAARLCRALEDQWRPDTSHCPTAMPWSRVPLYLLFHLTLAIIFKFHSQDGKTSDCLIQITSTEGDELQGEEEAALTTEAIMLIFKLGVHQRHRTGITVGNFEFPSGTPQNWPLSGLGSLPSVRVDFWGFQIEI